MKRKEDMQKKLIKQKGLMEWKFINPKRSVKILEETVNELTKDSQLRKDLMKFHKELLDRRYSAKIEVYNEYGRIGGYLNLHGFDPIVIQDVIEFLDWSLENKNYVSEKDFDAFVERKGLKIEKININNEEPIEQMTGLVTKVDFI